jgi:hypothetical protein
MILEKSPHVHLLVILEIGMRWLGGLERGELVLWRLLGGMGIWRLLAFYVVSLCLPIHVWISRERTYW